MSMNALKAALEGLSSDEAGNLESSSIGGDDNANAAEGYKVEDGGDDIQVLIAEASAQLESHYADTDEVFTQADELRGYMEENEAAHNVLREDIKDMRNTMSAITGSMEMLTTMTALKQPSPEAVMMANASLESLIRPLGMAVPSLESVGGAITTASLEGLVDFLKAGAAKIKTWFKTLFDNMALDKLRNQRSYATFEARIKRLQNIVNQMPDSMGLSRSTVVPYNDLYTNALYMDSKPVEFTVSGLTTALKAAGALGMMGITENSREHLANNKVINTTLPSLLMTIGNDGGEQATRDMVSKLALTPTLPKALNYGIEQAGGVTYREGSYRPSIRVATWAQIMVEMVEKDRTLCQIRRTGRAAINILEIKDINAVLDEMIDVITTRYDRYENYWGELVEAYNSSVSAYNKTMGLAHGTDHRELTSEVWKAIDLASYVMMDLFQVIIRETANVGIPCARLIDSVLYIVEEQMKTYAKVGRISNEALVSVKTVGGANDKLVAAAEEKLGLKFGTQYRAFLKKHGAMSKGSEEIYGVTVDENSSLSVVKFTLSQREIDSSFPNSVAVISPLGNGDHYVVDSGDTVSLYIHSSHSLKATGKDFNAFLDSID